MPELPETEVVARQLRREFLGARIRRLQILYPAWQNGRCGPDPGWCRSSMVEEVSRHGKNILVQLVRKQETCTLEIHLGMSGRLLKRPPGAPRLAHTHVIITFEDRPDELHFQDPRRFGKVILRSGSDLFRKGKDLLGISYGTFAALLAPRRGRIKALLMNQNVLAGIGNIYANEILFRARIHPERSAGGISSRKLRVLFGAMQEILKKAVLRGGTTFRDFRSLDGTRGSFQECLEVYGRAGRRCLRAGCPGTIRLFRTTSKGQATFYCPRCQRRGSHQAPRMSL